MAINFPDSPSSGDTHVVGDKTWSWNGTYWHVKQGVTVSSLVDADSDTKIQVEESSDEDIIRFDTGGTERMAILANGKVGIGTSAPGTALNVYVTGSTDGITLDGTTYPCVTLKGAGTVRGYVGIATGNGGFVNNSATGDVILRSDSTKLHLGTTSGAAALTVSGTKVGIGTVAPETPLHIVAANTLGSTFTGTVDGEGLRVAQSNYSADNYVSLVEAPYDDGQTAAHVRIAAMFDGGGSHLAFGTSNNYANGITNTAMFIDEVGKVFIGTAATRGGYSNLALGAGGNNPQIELYNANTSWSISHYDNDRLQIASNVSGSWVEARGITIKDATGNVGIGTTNPTHKLHAAGASFLLDGQLYLGDNAGSVSSVYNLYSNSSNLFLNAASGSAIYNRINNSTMMNINATGVSIGRGDSGAAVPLHVASASSGANAHSYTRMTVESDTYCAISILTPNDRVGYIMFADPQGTATSAVSYDHGSNSFHISTNSITRMTINSSGAMSKASGTFDIPHPTKGGDWRLRHSFVEGPKADLLYRGTVTLSGGTATIDLDTESNMADGTWEVLCQDPWAMAASSGNAVEWSLSGKTLTITSDTADAVCSWMVIGERQDDHMVIDNDWADDEGHLITEYEGVDNHTPPYEPGAEALESA